ncbi:MAG: hypothetical protein IJW40_01785 [Clostridia bacterium]|nr:hypothetical protein [Clostridia bacterium]
MNPIKVGFADEIITPQLNGIFLDGYGHRITPATGVRDELHAKVMALSDGVNTHLLFALDLIGLNPRLYTLVSHQIADLTDVPVSHISLVCIHTHAAPQAGILDEMPINTDYFAYVGELCGRAALRAMERACPCTVRAAVLPEELKHIFNRRGRPFIDRRIKAAAFYDEVGALRGVICNAACHAVINTEFAVSADWLAELNAISCDEVPYLFFQGRAADINPWQDEGMDIDAFITTLGRELSEPVAAFAAADYQRTSLQGSIVTHYEMVRIPMLAMGVEELREQVKHWSDLYFSLPIEDWNKHYYLRELQWARHMLAIAERGESFDIEVPLQLLTVGDAFAFALVPFELLTLPGERIEDVLRRAGFAEQGIYVCGYANSLNGYLAPPEEFEVGGYEVGGAAHWYNIPQTSPASAPAVVAWFEKNVGSDQK